MIDTSLKLSNVYFQGFKVAYTYQVGLFFILVLFRCVLESSRSQKRKHDQRCAVYLKLSYYVKKVEWRLLWLQMELLDI